MEELIRRENLWGCTSATSHFPHPFLSPKNGPKQEQTKGTSLLLSAVFCPTSAGCPSTAILTRQRASPRTQAQSRCLMWLGPTQISPIVHGHLPSTHGASAGPNTHGFLRSPELLCKPNLTVCELRRQNPIFSEVDCSQEYWTQRSGHHSLPLTGIATAKHVLNEQGRLGSP